MTGQQLMMLILILIMIRSLPQTNYYYRVMAYSVYIKSNYSAVVNATTQAAGTPAAPSEFTASVLSSSSIRLTWTDNSNNETGFILEYSTNNSTGVNLPAQI
jgi:titin